MYELLRQLQYVMHFIWLVIYGLIITKKNDTKLIGTSVFGRPELETSESNLSQRMLYELVMIVSVNHSHS